MSATTTRKVLVLDFEDASSKTRSIRISNPKDTLTAQQVAQAMETFIDLNAFASFALNGPMAVKGAKSVQTVTNKFDITID